MYGKRYVAGSFRGFCFKACCGPPPQTVQMNMSGSDFGFWRASPKVKISGSPLYGTALLFPQGQIIIVGVVRIRLFPIALAKICGTAGTLFTFLPVFDVEKQVAFAAYGNILHAEKLAALGYTNIVEFGGIID